MTPAEIKSLVSSIIKHSDFTRAEIADYIGCTPKRLKQYENGDRVPSAKSLTLLKSLRSGVKGLIDAARIKQ